MKELASKVQSAPRRDPGGDRGERLGGGSAGQRFTLVPRMCPCRSPPARPWAPADGALAVAVDTTPMRLRPRGLVREFAHPDPDAAQERRFDVTDRIRLFWELSRDSGGSRAAREIHPGRGAGRGSRPPRGGERPSRNDFDGERARVGIEGSTKGGALLTKRDLKHFRERTPRERKKLLSQLGYLEKAMGQTQRDSSGDLSAYSFHMATWAPMQWSARKRFSSLRRRDGSS